MSYADVTFNGSTVLIVLGIIALILVILYLAKRIF